MKKNIQIATSLILILFVLGVLTPSVMAEKTPKEKWQEAEDALTAAQKRMKPLELELKGYTTERDTIVADTPAEVLGLIGKGITPVLGHGLTALEMNRLIELDKLIASVNVKISDLNADIAMLASARDSAYAAYQAATNQPNDKGDDPEYGDTTPARLECYNKCGTFFSTSDAGVTWSNLAEKASNAHRVYCNVDSPHKGDYYYNCPSKPLTSCPLASEHRPTLAACGHPVPGHGKITMSGCGHSDYFCRRGYHDTRSCPQEDGKTCTVMNGLYFTCKTHSHVYPSDTTSGSEPDEPDDADSDTCSRCGQDDDPEYKHRERTCTRTGWVQRRYPGGRWRRVQKKCGETFSRCDNPSTCFGGRSHTN